MALKNIPNSIDEPAILMFWSQDEFLPMALVITGGFWSGWLTASFLISWITLKLYRRVRDGHQRGHFFHYFWWIGLGGVKNSFTIHNPFIREFRQ